MLSIYSTPERNSLVVLCNQNNNQDQNNRRAPRRSPPLIHPFKPLNNIRHRIFLMHSFCSVGLLLISTRYNYDFLSTQNITTISKRFVQNTMGRSSIKRQLVPHLSSIRPNGTIMIYVASSNTLFKLDDSSFAYVNDVSRLIYIVMVLK